MPLEIVRIPAFSDNYIWLVHDPDSKETMVVDPGESAQVLAEAERRGWVISAIWNTHWHPDHTGGNAAIKEATGAPVIAPAAEAERIPTADRLVKEGDMVKLGAHEAVVLEGHGEPVGGRSGEPGGRHEPGQGGRSGLQRTEHHGGFVQHADTARVVHALILPSRMLDGKCDDELASRANPAEAPAWQIVGTGIRRDQAPWARH